MIDFKITEEREVDGQIVYQKVRFYEGYVTTENEEARNEVTMQLELKPVTRYRRTTVIDEVEYTYGN